MADEVLLRTRTYYDSSDADNFYYRVWGGEDIHIGLYSSPNLSIAEASHATVVQMSQLVKPLLGPATRVLDLGSGYGGAARHLAATHGCHITCLNLSATENRRNEKKNVERGLSHLISVREGNFEELPFPDASFDIVWSQDAFLHSARKKAVIAEAARVLAPGGALLFTDPMQADDADASLLVDVYRRIHLDAMGSFALYKELAATCGLMLVEVRDQSDMLAPHYSRVRQVLDEMEPALVVDGSCSAEYIRNMRVGLDHWVTAAKKGLLRWGCLHFTK
eukprot:jgi/Mesvir1/14373/Mv09773-RA.1